jgi:hypothetical protein
LALVGGRDINDTYSAVGGGGGGVSESNRFRSGESSGGVKREGGGGHGSFEINSSIKIEESLLIEDVKLDEKQAYIKLKQEEKDTGNVYKQCDADDRIAEMLEAKVLNEIFNPEESK